MTAPAPPSPPDLHAGGGAVAGDLFWLNPAVASAAVASAAVAVPSMRARLELATDALDSAIASIGGQVRDMRERNGGLSRRHGPDSGTHTASVGLERALSVILEALGRARQMVAAPVAVRQAPRALLPALYVVRAAHMRLARNAAVGCQESLHDAAAHLGGVVLDAAAVSGASLSLGRSNAEVSAIFNQAELAVDSELGKRYGRLEAAALAGGRRAGRPAK